VGWAHIPDLGWGRRPKLHGMQEVDRWGSVEIHNKLVTDTILEEVRQVEYVGCRIPLLQATE
jgi:hypothetical protein